MVSCYRKISDKIYIEVINDLLEKWQRSQIEESKQKEVKMKMMEIVSFCAHVGYSKKVGNVELDHMPRKMNIYIN